LMDEAISANSVKVGKDGKDGVSITGPNGKAGADGVDGKVGISGKDGKDAVSIAGKDGVGHIGLTGPKGADGASGVSIDITTGSGKATLDPSVNNPVGSTTSADRIVYTDSNNNAHQVATMDDGLTFKGDNTTVITKKLNEQVDIVGGAAADKLTDNNIGVNAKDGKLKVQLAKDINLTDAGSVTIGGTTINNAGMTIQDGPSITTGGINAGGKQITNVVSGGNIDSNAANIGDVKQIAVANDKYVTGGTATYADNGTGTAKLTGTNGLTADVTGLHDYYITGATTSDDGKTVTLTKNDGSTVSLDLANTLNQDMRLVANPVDGSEGKYAVDTDGNITLKVQNANGFVSNDVVLKNVASKNVVDNIANTVNNIDNRVTNNETEIAKGLNFAANSGTTYNAKLGSTVTVQGTAKQAGYTYSADNLTTEIDANGNITILMNNAITTDSIKVGKDGKDGVSITGSNGKNGADGVDGKVGIAGKDGKDAVSIAGKDGVGHIGLTGPKGENGKDGVSIDITTDSGKATLDPAVNNPVGKMDSADRIVYTDSNNNTHQVATMNDGLTFKGDNTTVITKKLNEQLDIVGGADAAKLTDNNIGVNATGGKLKVQLAKNINLTADGSIITGNTVVNNSGLIITNPADSNKTISITTGKVSMGGNQITKVESGASGEADGKSVYNTLDNAANIGDVKNIAESVSKANDTNTVTTVTQGNGITVTPGANNNATNKTFEVKLNDTFTVGSGNTSVTVDGTAGKVNVGGSTGTTVTKDSVNIGGTDGTNLTKDGLTIGTGDTAIKLSKDDVAMGGNQITKVGSGASSIVDGKSVYNTLDNAANIGDVKNIAESIAKENDTNTVTTVTAGNGIIVTPGVNNDATNKTFEVKLSDSFAVGTGDKAVSIDGNNGKVTIGGNGGGTAITKDTITVGGVSVNGDSSTITGLTNKTWNPDAITSGRAATEDQLKAVDDKITGGRVFSSDTKDVNNNPDKVTIGLGDTFKLNGGAASDALTDRNIGVVTNASHDGFDVKLAKDLKGLSSATFTTKETDTTSAGETVEVTRETTVTGNGILVTGNASVNGKTVAERAVSIQADNVDMGGNQIHHVAAGTADDDAVNVSQLNRVGQKLGERINYAGANAAALAALHPLDFDPDDKWDFAAGYGNYAGANAAAIGAYYRPNEDTMFSVGASLGGGENMINAGVSVKLGQGNHVSTSRVAMAKEIKDMRQAMAELTGLVHSLMSEKQGVKLDTSTLFPDVPENHWAYEYVSKLAGAGIVEGYPDGNFGGDRMMTRYEFAAVVYRALQNGAVNHPELDPNGDLSKLVKEFDPELKYIRIDTIATDNNGNPTIERVRVKR
ncbi:S-layer homology domain-containing protein, partial [Veillonella caviae]|uniref:S-layer homology domain-containing protein n=3 Tax=Veillonella caviae TaxID=248316 RepID=UPI0023F71B9C